MPENRTKTGQFKKGVSGNPGGRPKMDNKVEKILRAASEDAAHALVDMLEAANPQYRIKAAEAILDRLYGKPAQSTYVDGDITASGVTVVEFKGELAEWSE